MEAVLMPFDRYEKLAQLEELEEHYLPTFTGLVFLRIKWQKISDLLSSFRL